MGEGRQKKESPVKLGEYDGLKFGKAGNWTIKQKLIKDKAINCVILTWLEMFREQQS